MSSTDIAYPRPTRVPIRSIRGPGVVLGVGLGGFVDGIVLHQILQWHHMLSESERYPPTSLAGLEANVLADGLFHAVTWLFVVAGIAWLWNTARNGGWTWRWRTLLGWMLVGWGLFNLVEGVVDHHLLGIHRVRPEAADPLMWDIGFLVIGVALVAIGTMLQPRDPARHPDPRDSVTYLS
ncbi:MAG TPA: DUF2243 domain-containing protein [Acidimicrobiia bacterium]